ncbi:unnamed protein product [Paramecium octaurelia]|uniref:Uncharacterized protein n=1 Tax=Paramecium octaurelia TaxID=43137 RepID=A0A8S1ULW8_PAROT|nr:unnamed protein product [Paramecium octaurelia]
MQNQESQQNSLADTQQQVCETYQAITEFFDQLPNCITTLKKQHLLDKASVNTRFVLLCLTTLTTAGLTARITPSFIKVTRNTIFSYLGAGLFIVPEVFNPYLIYRK